MSNDAAYVKSSLIKQYPSLVTTSLRQTSLCIFTKHVWSSLSCYRRYFIFMIHLFCIKNSTRIPLHSLVYLFTLFLFLVTWQCIPVVDYYASMFFFEITSIKPDDLRAKANLYGAQKRQDSCEFCHQAIYEVLVELKDPNIQVLLLFLLGVRFICKPTSKFPCLLPIKFFLLWVIQMDIIELLLKGCDRI